MKGRTEMIAVALLVILLSPLVAALDIDDGGSAPYLLGDAKVIAIFVSTPDHQMSRLDVSEGTARLNRALDWLEEQCPHHLAFTANFFNAEGEELSYVSQEKISQELFGKGLSALARDELKCYDSCAFLFITGERGRSYAVPYDPALCYDSRMGTDSFWGERAVIYMRTRMGTLKDPATYAHELLHLFGARDKYEGLWKSQKLYPVKELEELWFEGGSGEDIMSSVSSLTFIDEITRGEIGWQDSNGNGVPDPLDPQLTKIF